MKRFITTLFSMLFMFSFTACGEESPYQEIVNVEQENTNDSTNNQNDENMETYQIRIKVGNHELTATLLDNATTRAFVDMLPITLTMLDLYGREMCYRFPEALPADEARRSGYDVGDIAYWTPRHSFVIFYEQNGEIIGNLQKIGRIHSDVDLFARTGDTDVTFELLNE